MSRLVALHASGSPEPWQQLGISCVSDVCQLADVQLHLNSGSSGQSGSGLISWTFDVGRTGQVDIDGISTTLVAFSPDFTAASVIGSERMVSLDHVVVNTDNLDRTCAAIERELGIPMRREREVGNGVVQRFHKLDNTIIEVVTGPHVSGVGASLWGMVVSVDDLFDWAEHVGSDIVSPPKKATQPGRYISTVRSSVGLGVPFALMTPHVSGMDTHN
jgi:hypothetical protein